MLSVLQTSKAFRVDVAHVEWMKWLLQTLGLCYVFLTVCDNLTMLVYICCISFHMLPIQPSYLHNLISLQPPRCTRTSSVVTLSRPPASSSLQITNRSFRHASPHLWNKLPVSLRQPCLNQPSSPSSSSLSPLSSSITPSLFHSKLKTYLFQISFPPYTPHTHQPDWFHGFLAVSVFFSSNGFLFSSHFICFLVYGAVR